MFDAGVIKAVRLAWEADQNHPNRNRAQMPIPGNALLREMIEVAFVASLKREEGREIGFALAFVPREETERTRWLHGPHVEVAPFECPQPLTAESIAKLAPACDPDLGVLMVDSQDGSDDDYCVWGMMFHGAPLRYLTSISVHLGELSAQRPEILTITTAAPGSLAISRGMCRIGRFVLGEFMRAEPSPFVHRALGQFVRAYLEDCRVGLDSGDDEQARLRGDHAFFAALEHLLEQVRKRGHGGAVILIPQSAHASARADARIRHELKHDLQMEKCFDLMHKYARYIAGLAAAKAALRERLEFLAQLACRDGALLLRGALRPIGFGATLSAATWAGDVLPGPAPYAVDEKPLDLGKLGDRHNSAANFVAAHPGCIAFVISQDGPIRAFMRQREGPLLYWADCTLSMFL